MNLDDATQAAIRENLEFVLRGTARRRQRITAEGYFVVRPVPYGLGFLDSFPFDLPRVPIGDISSKEDVAKAERMLSRGVAVVEVAARSAAERSAHEDALWARSPTEN
jgi:hypothetical protein